MATGFAVLLLAGLCQGSFGLGYKNHKPFSWAAFWGIYNIMCIITNITFNLLIAPKVFTVLSEIGFSALIIPMLCGALWGLSAIGFSKGIDKIGMSLVYGISMGISTIVGSVTPMIINSTYPVGKSAVMFAAGLILTVLGVIIVTVAGVKRDEGAKSSVFGIILAVLSGLGSGVMNVGFARGSFFEEPYSLLGYSQTALSAAKWMPVLLGGCITGLTYCIYEVTAKKQWHTVTDKGSAVCAAKLFGTSIIWYAALILYGLSAYLLGTMGNTVGWILFNALALIISVGWGLKTGEWKNAKKGTLFAGCAVLIVAWVFTALV